MQTFNENKNISLQAFLRRLLAYHAISCIEVEIWIVVLLVGACLHVAESHSYFRYSLLGTYVPAMARTFAPVACCAA